MFRGLSGSNTWLGLTTASHGCTVLMYSWTRSGFHGSRSSREAFQVEEAAAAKAQGWEKWGAHLGGWQESRVEGAADVCGGAEGGLKPQARNPLLACWPSGSVGTDPPP